MVFWWLSSCCCKENETQFNLIDQDGLLLDAPIEWQTRMEQTVSRLQSSEHSAIKADLIRENRFWAQTAISSQSKGKLATWITSSSDDEESDQDIMTADSRDRFNSFFQNYASQLVYHEGGNPSNHRITTFGDARLLKTRDSAQFIMDQATSLSYDDLESSSDSCHLQFQTTAKDLISSDELFPESSCREDLTTSIKKSLSGEESIESPTPSDDRSDSLTTNDVTTGQESVGDEGVAKFVVDWSVDMLVVKRNRFIRVIGFRTNVDEQRWIITRKGDERCFDKKQISNVVHVKPIQSLLKGQFTKNQFNNLSDSERAKLEDYSVVVHVVSRQVPYIIIFNDVSQKDVFVARLERMLV